MAEKLPSVPEGEPVPIPVVVRLRRMFLGLSVIDLAVQTRLGISTIKHLEFGQGYSDENLNKLADCLLLEPNEIKKVNNHRANYWRNQILARATYKVRLT